MGLLGKAQPSQGTRRRDDSPMLENWAKLSGFAAILAAVLSVSFLWALNYVPPQNAEWTCEAKTDANDPSKPALNTFTCHTKQSENLESQPARTNKQGNQDSSDNIKTTDVLLVFFTGMLVIVTAVLIAVGISQAMRWSRFSEQIFRVDKWSVCRG